MNTPNKTTAEIIGTIAGAILLACAAVLVIALTARAVTWILG